MYRKWPHSPGETGYEAVESGTLTVRGITTRGLGWELFRSTLYHANLSLSSSWLRRTDLALSLVQETKPSIPSLDTAGVVDITLDLMNSDNIAHDIPHSPDHLLSSAGFSPLSSHARDVQVAVFDAVGYLGNWSSRGLPFETI
jgi:hypothetical protein